MNPAFLAIIGLLTVQLCIAGGCAFLYARFRSKADAERTLLAPWGIKVEAAIGTANDAKRAVETIELEHYKSLRSLFESQALQIANLKAENTALLQRIESLEVKVQTLQRMDRKERNKEAKLAADPWKPVAEERGEDGKIPDDLLHREGIPLNNHNGAQPQATGRPGFGLSAH